LLPYEKEIKKERKNPDVPIYRNNYRQLYSRLYAIMLKVLDLFSGIGGFSLGLEAAGPFETIAFVENEPYCQAVLKHHWPRTPILGDIKNVKKEDIPTRPDVIVGGFPCQPFSVAGTRQAQDDPRHLWPDMFRLIQEFRPDWVIGENVAGLINLGLDEVLTDLENEGYTTRTFNIPACAVGAPHQRYRLWIVANLHSGSEPEPTRPEQQGFNFGDVGNPEHHGSSPDQGPGGVLHKPEEQGGTNPLRKSAGTSSTREHVADTDGPGLQVAHNNSKLSKRLQRKFGDGSRKRREEEDTDVADPESERTRTDNERLRKGTSGVSGGQRTNVADTESKRSGKSRVFNKTQGREGGGKTQLNRSSEDVADTERTRLEGFRGQGATISGEDTWTFSGAESGGRKRNVSNANEPRLEGHGEFTEHRTEEGRTDTQRQSSEGDIPGDVGDANNTGHRTSQHGVERKGKAYITNRKGRPQSEPSGSSANLSNTKRVGRTTGSAEKGNIEGQESSGESYRRSNAHDTRPFEEGWWESEPAVGRVAHGIPNRVSQLRALGNSVVPQVVKEIGLAIMEAEK